MAAKTPESMKINSDVNLFRIRELQLYSDASNQALVIEFRRGGRGAVVLVQKYHAQVQALELAFAVSVAIKAKIFFIVF